MENKQYPISKTLLPGLELSLIFFILCGSAVQVIFGQQHTLFLLLRLIYTPGIVLLAGLYTSKDDNNVSFLLKHAAVYAVLFIFFGLCNQVLLNHKKPFQSVIRLVTMVKIPTPSEMFFTAAVLFLCAGLAARYVDRIYKRKRLLILAGVLAIAFAFFPSDIFGYPIIGVFTGCETYDCIALLPYLGYFIGGIFLGKENVLFSKKISVGSLVVSFISAVLLFTPLKEAALITLPAFPVYLLYLLAGLFIPFRKLTEGLLLLGDKGIAVLRGWYQDFMNNRRKALPL